MNSLVQQDDKAPPVGRTCQSGAIRPGLTTPASGHAPSASLCYWFPRYTQLHFLSSPVLVSSQLELNILP
jgi:hypothetical protein